jgi:hypothetical protein
MNAVQARSCKKSEQAMTASLDKTEEEQVGRKQNMDNDRACEPMTIMSADYGVRHCQPVMRGKGSSKL